MNGMDGGLRRDGCKYGDGVRTEFFDFDFLSDGSEYPIGRFTGGRTDKGPNKSRRGVVDGLNGVIQEGSRK